jgi:biopolymer transport protein ExbD
VKAGKSMVIYPILLAVFPVFFLYTQNIDQSTARQALSPLLYAIPGTLVVWLLFYLWMRNIFKAALATTLLLMLFFFYGRISALLEAWGASITHSILLPLLVLVWGYLVYFIKVSQRDFRSTTKVLNLIGVMLILINVFNIVSYQISKPIFVDQATPTQSAVAAIDSASSEAQPDIYFIILDEYASPAVMKDLYGYDNGEFLDNLKNQGFFVAADSQMHNNETIRVVASILNMEYTPESEPTEVSYQRIENNAVVNFLRSKGYQYIYFGQWYEEQRYQIPADIYFNFYEAAEKGTLTPEYSAILWNTTAITPFYNYLFGNQYEGYYRDGLLNTLSQLGKVPEMPGPKFVYAHLLCPHAPFIFGPNGEPVASTKYYEVDDKQYYLGQYIFISREIDKVIQEILHKSSSDPIIIVQSDHGPRWTDQWERIFNAYHLPGDGNALLYNNISPVNSFRLIFNHYFQTNYEMLEDK